MALGLLTLMGLLLIVILILLTYLLFNKNEKISNNKTVLICSRIFPVILGIVYFTSLPSNYIPQRIVSVILTVLSLLITFIASKNLRTSKIITILISTILILLIFLM